MLILKNINAGDPDTVTDILDIPIVSTFTNNRLLIK